MPSEVKREEWTEVTAPPGWWAVYAVPWWPYIEWHRVIAWSLARVGLHSGREFGSGIAWVEAAEGLLQLADDTGGVAVLGYAYGISRFCPRWWRETRRWARRHKEKEALKRQKEGCK